MAKQLLPLNSSKSMIQETVERLSAAREGQASGSSPTATCASHPAPAPSRCGTSRSSPSQLAATLRRRSGWPRFLLEHDRSDSRDRTCFLPTTSSSTRSAFAATFAAGREIAASGANIVVMGIQPTRPETGYGYIEAGSKAKNGALQRAPLHREARRRDRAAVRRRREFLLEQRHVRLGRANPGRRAARASAQNRAVAGEDRRQLRHSRDSRRLSPSSIPSAKTSASTTRVLEPRSAKGEGKSGIFCIPAELRLERPGLVDGALRASQRRQSSDGSQRHRLPTRVSARMRRAISSTRPRSSWRPWA